MVATTLSCARRRPRTRGGRGVAAWNLHPSPLGRREKMSSKAGHVDCIRLQLQRCAWLRACRMHRPSEGAAPHYTRATRSYTEARIKKKKQLLKLQDRKDTAKGMCSPTTFHRY